MEWNLYIGRYAGTWCLFYTTTTFISCLSSDSCSGHRVDWRRKSSKLSHKSVFFFFSPCQTVPFRALRHESITTLSTGHLRMSYLPWAPSVHYSDGRVSGGEKKSSDLHQSFAASHLGNLTGSCKRKDRQLLTSLGEDRPLPTDQLFRLIEPTVSSFLPQRRCSLRLSGVKTVHF